MNTSIRIRHAKPSDLEGILDIYNYYVRETPITFDLTPVDPKDRKNWLGEFRETGLYQMFVAEKAGRLIGYCYSGQFRTRAAYDTSVETTVYLRNGEQRGGVGHALYTRLFQALAGENIHRIYAGATMPNEASVGFHKAFGFKPCGYWNEVGFKFGSYWDVAWFEKRIDAGGRQPVSDDESGEPELGT